MTPLVWAVSVVGALAVIAAVVWLVVGLTQQWSSANAKRARNVFYVLGGICAVIGVLIAFVPQ